MSERFRYTDQIIADSNDWLKKRGRGALRDFCERFNLPYESFLTTRCMRRSGRKNGEQTRKSLAWRNEEGNVLGMIRGGSSVSEIARNYGIKATAMHERLVRMGLTPDIRAEMARGEWDEIAGS